LRTSPFVYINPTTWPHSFMLVFVTSLQPIYRVAQKSKPLSRISIKSHENRQCGWIFQQFWLQHEHRIL